MANKAAERRVLYRKRRENGCCPRCGVKVGKRSKFIYCDVCREFFRNYNREMSEDLNEARKERYDQRKENNQCPRCGKPLGKKYRKTICTKCLEKQYVYNYGDKKTHSVKRSR